jgi:AhpD family alkylhydroperoxidase
MQPRLDLAKFSGSGSSYKAMLGLEASLAQSTLPVALKHMLKLRASQINGCAYCIDMHWKDARAAGESEQRLYGLDAWEESPYYTDRERAALAYMESVTRIADTHVPDDVFDRVRSHFSNQEVVDLTWLAATINAWNRVAIALRSEPGKYQPPAHARH